MNDWLATAFDKETADIQQIGGFKLMSILTVEIMRPGSFGLHTSATLKMPATWAEFQDAKQKARITDDKVIYSSEILDCKYDWLRPHIHKNANLLELNLLATRMDKYVVTWLFRVYPPLGSCLIDVVAMASFASLLGQFSIT